LYHLRGAFSGIRIYREWDVGEGSHLRNPQPADLDEAFLYESGQNLPSVINDLDNRPRALEPLVARLQRFYEAVERLTTRASANTLLLMIQERGLKEAIPATRLSDGTLRYLCLLAILCHPEPPPLICIEEPELGLHPDVLHSVAELLVEASQRTQLIVTTHSDLLVSALSEVPEAVVVCERTDEGTELRRLEPDKLKDWLERYSLGELWTMGELGGNP
jgi:predicted ATPase